MKDLFLNEMHQCRYNSLIDTDKTKDGDTYRESFFYIMASSDDLYNNITKMYNFTKHSLILDDDLSFLTGETSRLRALAIELFTSRQCEDYNLNSIFNYLSEDSFTVAINGIKVRFKKY